jgi:uncharacterized protein (TIGR02246 family)
LTKATSLPESVLALADELRGRVSKGELVNRSWILRVTFAALGLWAVLAPAASAQDELASDAPATAAEAPAEAAIRALIEEVEAANNAGDVERWVGFFSDDFVYMTANAPAVTTREGLVEVAEAGFRHDADIHIEPVEIEVHGDWAFARSAVTGTVTLQDSREVVAVDVKQIVIYRKGDDGRWKVARLIGNSNTE